MPHPTTRVLAVLELLQSHGRISGPELARRLDLDVRTLRRYIAVLEELGIPITAERGRHGAYLLVAGFKLPPMMFTAEEALALSIGLLLMHRVHLADAAPAAASAQAKLERVMPATLKRRVRAVEETVRVDLSREPHATASSARGSAAVLMALAGAAQAQRRVHLHYRAENGVDTERDFDPYGLAYRGGSWYAVGMCHLRRGLRSLRLDRMRDVQPGEVGFSKPRGFDALDHLARSVATMPRAIRVEVLLRTDLQTAQAHFTPAIGLFEPVEGGVLLRSRTDHVDWFARQLAQLPFDFEVRRPARLRAALKTCALRLLALAEAG